MEDKTFSEAWNEFIDTIAKQLKIDKLLDWLNKKIN